MRRIDRADAVDLLASPAGMSSPEPLMVTEDDAPVLALVPLSGVDIEDVEQALVPEFIQRLSAPAANGTGAVSPPANGAAAGESASANRSEYEDDPEALIVSPHFLCDRYGNREAVVLSMADWDKVLEAFEDLDALGAVERARKENEAEGGEAIPLEDFAREMGWTLE